MYVYMYIYIYIYLYAYIYIHISIYIYYKNRNTYLLLLQQRLLLANQRRKWLVFTSWAYAHKRWLSNALRWKTWASASGRVDLGLDCGLSSAVLRTSILFIVRGAKIFIQAPASPHLQWCKFSSVKPKPKLHSCRLCEQYWPWRSTGQLARESSSSTQRSKNLTIQFCFTLLYFTLP